MGNDYWCFFWFGHFYCLLELSCGVIDAPVGAAAKLSTLQSQGAESFSDSALPLV